MHGGVKFISSKEQEVTLELPHKGKLTGMGIKKGITLIVGGGYHGKSDYGQTQEPGFNPFWLPPGEKGRQGLRRPVVPAV